MSEFSVKVSFQGENRRFQVKSSSTLQDFKTQCLNTFKTLSNSFDVKYYDDENDLIVCEQEDEFLEAKRLASRLNGAGAVLKIQLITTSAPSSSVPTVSDVATDVKNVLSRIYKETEKVVSEDLVSEAVKVLQSLGLSEKQEQKQPEELVIDVSRDTLELRGSKAEEKKPIQNHPIPTGPVPTNLEQSWTFIEMKEDHHEEEASVPVVEPKPAEVQELPKIEQKVEEKVEEKQPVVPVVEKVEQKPVELPKVEPLPILHDCKFVDDVTIPDGSQIEAGTVLLKTWLVQNTGVEQFPEATMMVYLSGPNPNLIELKFVADVPRAKPQETVEVTIQMRAPMTLGKYKGTFRLCNKYGEAFGQPFYFDFESIAQKPIEKKPVAPIVNPAPIIIEQPKVNPLIAKYQQEIGILAGMGFGDADKVANLLEKFKGDVNLVIDSLLN